jgi:hypothetical protein
VIDVGDLANYEKKARIKVNQMNKGKELGFV